MITEKLKIPNRLGLNLATIVSRKISIKPSPAVIVLHGFTGFKSEPHISKFAEDLADAGFVSVRFDASGFGESDGEPFTDFRVSSYLSDIFDVVTFIEGLDYVHRNRIGLTGHSLGSNLAIIAAGSSDKFIGCCAVQPCTKLPRPTWARDLTQWQKIGFAELESPCPQYPKFRLPWEFVQDADRFDARSFVRNINCPLEIIYGTADTTVLPSDTLSICELAPPQTTVTPLPGVGHYIWESPKQLADISSRIVKFFGKTVRVPVL